MRRFARTFLALILSAVLTGSAFATPAGGGGGADNSPGGLFDSEQTIDRIPLVFSDEYSATVLYLFVITALHIYAFETLNAVAQRTENRLPLARLPLLGHLARPEYRSADFAPENQVGTYYQLGKSLVVDLRPATSAVPASSISIDWDKLETKLAGEARRPVPGEIAIDGKAGESSASVGTITVLNRDSSFGMLLGGAAVSEETAREAIPFLSNLPTLARMFRSGKVTRRERELLVLVKPSIVERSWD